MRRVGFFPRVRSARCEFAFWRACSRFRTRTRRRNPRGDRVGSTDRSELAHGPIDGALQGAPIARGHFVVALPRNDMGKIRRNVLRRSLLTTSAESGSQQRRSGEPARGLHEPACAGTGKAGFCPKRSPGYPRDAGLVGRHLLLTSRTTGAYRKILVDPAFAAARYAQGQYPYGISDRSENAGGCAFRPHGARPTPCSGHPRFVPVGKRGRDYPHTIDLLRPADFGDFPNERYR